MLAGLLARMRSWCRSIFRPSTVESEMEEEFRHHIDSRAADLIRSGLSPREARRRAHIEFGHVEAHRQAGRGARGLGFLDRIHGSWIDAKLGLRMMVKHPGLTLVAVFALGIGIPVGLAPLHLAKAIEAPLPEDRGDRVRAIRYWDPATTSVAPATIYDYELLRSELTSFESIGAYRSSQYGISAEGDGAAPVLGAEVSASIFEILGTGPLLGRVLSEADEAAGATDVVVLGYDVWSARFGADPGIVGRTVRISEAPRTVVGVMPRGFHFPLLQQAWLPLRDDPAVDSDPGPAVYVVGRLASGVDAPEAQAEIEAVGLRARDDQTEARARLQPEVVPFGLQYMGIPRGGLDAMPEFYAFQLLALVLLLVSCANVAMLVFARTATRFQELAVRTALGASRTRIVTQVFVEALVLAVVAAGVGLFVIDWILGRAQLAALVGEVAIPYWFSLRVTPSAVVSAVALAAVSAVAAGVVPAIRITGTRIQESIRRAEAGRSGIRFGGVTSALVAADVAVSITAIALAIGMADRMLTASDSDALTGIPAEEFLAATVSLPAADPASYRERLATAQQAIAERLSAEPGVRSVGVASALPRMDHPSRVVEIEGVEPTGTGRGTYVRTATVDVDYFDALAKPIVTGRGFDRADLVQGAPPVIVNTVFVDRFLEGLDPIGRRIRFIRRGAPESDWLEIVGVVGHLGVNIVNPAGDHAVYVLGAPGAIAPLRFAIHLGSSPEDFVPRMRELVAEVDPDLVLSSTQVLSDVHQGDWYLVLLVAGGLGLLTVILVVLAASGIYAMMSFSVAERTREIGVRSALGAGRARLVLTVLRRSLMQLGIGAAIGMPVAARVSYELRASAVGDASPAGSVTMGVLLACAIVATVGLCSCLSPVRKLLGIEPSEALRGAD